jgi:hypothetical protein
LPAAVELVFSVMVVLPDALSDVGLKVAVAPDGSPVAPKATLEANPPVIVSVPVSVVVAVGDMDTDVGETANEKFFTVRVKVVVLAMAPFVPVTVMV